MIRSKTFDDENEQQQTKTSRWTEYFFGAEFILNVQIVLKLNSKIFLVRNHNFHQYFKLYKTNIIQVMPSFCVN